MPSNSPHPRPDPGRFLALAPCEGLLQVEIATPHTEISFSQSIAIDVQECPATASYAPRAIAAPSNISLRAGPNDQRQCQKTHWRRTVLLTRRDPPLKVRLICSGYRGLHFVQSLQHAFCRLCNGYYGGGRLQKVPVSFPVLSSYSSNKAPRGEADKRTQP